MYATRKTKIPFWLFFIVYLVYYLVTWGALSDIFSFLICWIKGNSWSWTQYYSNKSLFEWVFPSLVLSPYVYYFQCHHMVSKIEIDENQKIIKINYRIFFFWNREKVYPLYDSRFWILFNNTKENIFAEFVNMLFIPHCNTTIGFGLLFDNDENKSRTHIILRDRCGWKKEQLLELYHVLEKYSHQSDIANP